MPCFIISFNIFTAIFLGFYSYFGVVDIYRKRWHKSFRKDSYTISCYIRPVGGEVKVCGKDSLKVYVRKGYIKIPDRKYLGELRRQSKDYVSSISPEFYDISRIYNGLGSDGASGNSVPRRIRMYIEIWSGSFPRKDGDIIILMHGMNSSATMMRRLSVPLALAGYTVISYDARGIGRSAGAGNVRSFISRNIDADMLVRRVYGDLSPRRLFVMGESMGSISAVYSFYRNPGRINGLICVSAPSVFGRSFDKFTFPFSARWFLKLHYRLKGINPHPPRDTLFMLSPALMFTELVKKKELYNNARIMLIHSSTDNVIPVGEFFENIEILNIPPRNRVLFTTGGHNLIRNEPAILSAVLTFLTKQNSLEMNK